MDQMMTPAIRKEKITNTDTTFPCVGICLPQSEHYPTNPQRDIWLHERHLNRSGNQTKCVKQGGNTVRTADERPPKAAQLVSGKPSVTLILCGLPSPLLHLLFHLLLFLLQVTYRLAHVTCSPASRTPPCGGSSSSSSGGPASMLWAAAPCPSNCTMSGGRGCTKPTGYATR